MGETGQGRAGQGRAGQGRAGQGRAGQGRAGQGRAYLLYSRLMGRHSLKYDKYIAFLDKSNVNCTNANKNISIHF